MHKDSVLCCTFCFTTCKSVARDDMFFTLHCFATCKSVARDDIYFLQYRYNTTNIHTQSKKNSPNRRDNGDSSKSTDSQVSFYIY